ncbi:MAG: exosortase/archaeosortase family protein [Sedimentisphaerales bacterium]|nr:exosortase/archaeosortase family protein [Sedimentisphaerales bacterium]
MANQDVRRRPTPQTFGGDRAQDMRVKLVLAALALSAVTLWSYWPVMAGLFDEWQTNDDYSAGQLVPLVAVFLVWRDRKALGRCPMRPRWLWGIGLLVLAQAARAYGLLFMFESAERYSLVLTVVSLVLLVAGWQVLQRVKWILLFLFFMIPFPGRVHNLISGPLQRVATNGSVFLLEVIGVRVSQEGNVVTLNGNTPLAVAEACSGLRMLTAFIIVAAFIACMVNRSRLQKAVLLLSSIPVAVLCNIARISVTAVLMLVVNADVAQKFFHDFAGIVMMPVAVLLMFAEIWVMDRLIEPEPDSRHRRTVESVRSGAGSSV